MSESITALVEDSTAPRIPNVLSNFLVTHRIIEVTCSFFEKLKLYENIFQNLKTYQLPLALKFYSVYLDLYRNFLFASMILLDWDLPQPSFKAAVQVTICLMSTSSREKSLSTEKSDR